MNGIRADPKKAIAETNDTTNDDDHKKEIETFLMDNMVHYVIWNDGTGTLKRKENVPLIMMPGSHVYIIEEKEHTLIRWGQVIEIVFPPREKMLKVIMASANRQEKFIEKMTQKPEADGREFG